jgi:hypothetical protein
MLIALIHLDHPSVPQARDTKKLRITLCTVNTFVQSSGKVAKLDGLTISGETYNFWGE